MGMIPKSTTSENKIWKNFTMSRIIGLIIALVLGIFIGSLVCQTWGSVLLTAGNVIGFFVLSAKDVTNPRQKFYMGYKSWLVSHIKHKAYYSDTSDKALEYFRKEENRTNEKNLRKNRKEKSHCKTKRATKK